MALRSVQIVMELPSECDALLREILHRTDGLEAGFDECFPLEHLRVEAQELQGNDYVSLRKNCLLGVCASFEDYVKTVAAALSYEPDWKALVEGGRLRQDTSADFHERFAEQDKAWRSWQSEKYDTYFLSARFSEITNYREDRVREVFWLRNQFAHNAGVAGMKKNEATRCLEILGKTFSAGELLELDASTLKHLSQYLLTAMNDISNELPYFEATL